MHALSTRERISEAALHLISQKGYHGASTREIARAAGVTEITLFRHFGSKEALLEDVLNRFTFLPRLRELISEAEEMPADEALNRIGQQFFLTLQQRKRLVVIMLSESNTYPDKVRSIYNRFVKKTISLLAEYIERQQNRKVLGGGPPDIIARALLGMIFSFFHAEEIIRDREVRGKEAEEVVRQFVSIVLDGIRR